MNTYLKAFGLTLFYIAICGFVTAGLDYATGKPITYASMQGTLLFALTFRVVFNEVSEG